MVLSRRRPGGVTETVGRGTAWVRAQAVLRQFPLQKRCLPTGWKTVQQTGQAGLAGGAVVVVVVSSCGGVLVRMAGGLPQVLGMRVVGTESVAVALEVHHDAAVQQPVEHRGSYHLVAQN